MRRLTISPRTGALAIAAMAVALAAPGRGTEPNAKTPPRRDDGNVWKAAAGESLPNYESDPDSPDLADVGLQIKLARKVIPAGAVIVVHGAYMLDQLLAREAGGAPLSKVIIEVRRKGEKAVWSEPVQSAENLIPAPAQADAPNDASYRDGGYFNLDLRQMCRELQSPGHYTVRARMGKLTSDEIEIEIVGK